MQPRVCNMIWEELALVKQMAAESHGEKKRIIWPFLPSKWVKFSVLLIKFFFCCSELIRVHFYFIFIFLFDPSRSELIQPGQAVRVDPVRLLFVPHFSSMLFFSEKPDQPTVAPLKPLKSMHSTKLLEKLLTWAAHTFHWRLWWFPWNVWNWEV